MVKLLRQYIRVELAFPFGWTFPPFSLEMMVVMMMVMMMVMIIVMKNTMINLCAVR